MENAARDQNSVPTLLAVSSADGKTPIRIYADPGTHRLLVSGLGTPFNGFANPTAQIGLTAIDGVATTAMRSDAAPALNQAIIPTWTGNHTFTNGITFEEAAKNYEVIATNIAGDDRLVFRATSAIEARYWFDSNGFNTGISLAESGVEKVYFGTEIGTSNTVLDTLANEFKLKTNNAANFAILDTSPLTADRIYQFPDAAGTLALTSDSPSGTYAPTLTPGTNVTSATANGNFFWYQTGNFVTIVGSLDITATATGAALVQVSLPVAPAGNFADTHKLSGSGAATDGSAIQPVYLRSNSGAVTGIIDWIAPSTAAHSVRIMATYIIT